MARKKIVQLFLASFLITAYGLQFVEQTEIRWTDAGGLLECLENGQYLCLVYVGNNYLRNCIQMNEIMSELSNVIRYKEVIEIGTKRVNAKNILEKIKIAHVDCSIGQTALLEKMIPECADYAIQLPRLTLYRALEPGVMNNSNGTVADREQEPFENEANGKVFIDSEKIIPEFDEDFGVIEKDAAVNSLLVALDNAADAFNPNNNDILTFIGSNPYWNFQDTYIAGSDLVQKFTKSFVECGEACQAFANDECHAFTWKKREPVKGICSLKKAPSDTQPYRKQEVIGVYDSAERSAQSFPTCQGNAYGPDSVYDPKTEKELGLTTGCWTAQLKDETGEYGCSIKNPQCISLRCTSNHMLIEVRKDAFENIGVVDAQGNAATFILNNATRMSGNLESDSNECAGFVEAEDVASESGRFIKSIYNQTLNFELPLDECGMEMRVSDNQISFLMTIELEKEIGTGPLLQSNELSHKLSFMCSFSNEVYVHQGVEEDEEDIGMVVTRDFHNGIFEESSLFETRPEIVLFETATFENEIDLTSSSRSMSIGRNVYFKIIWDIGLTLASPVVFYAQNCRVSERNGPEAERKHYDIIFNGRGSILTSTKLRSPSVFAKRELRFSFRSFVFDQGIEEYNMDISCNINFCLENSKHTEKCRYTKTIRAIPDNYYEEFEGFPE